MENRLDSMFEQLRGRNEGALIPLSPGDKAPFKISNEIIEMFMEAGADAIEIALPTRYPWMEQEYANTSIGSARGIGEILGFI